MEPHKEIINAAVGNLWFCPIGPKQTEPVLRGDHIVGVRGVLCEVQGTQELLPLLRTQGMDVPSNNWWFLLITVGANPAKLAVSTVIASEVS